MSDASPRVALLARAGDACDRIGAALRDAGAQVVLIADPADTAEASVRAAAPQAIVVALEPAIEDALEGYDDLLSDPAYVVIFEEADLAAQRVGWDAARWLRHLTAKLHRHADVLPPGGEDEADLQPSPGPLPARRDVIDLEEAIVAFTDEAQQHAGDVPRDTGLEGVPAVVADDSVASAFDPVAFESSDFSFARDDAASPFDPVAFEAADLVLAADGEADAAAVFDFSGLSLLDETSANADAEAGEQTVPGTEADAGAEAGIDIDETSTRDDVALEAGSEDPAGEAEPALSTGGLSLVDADAEFAVARRDAGADAATVDRLEARISGLSLVDPDSYGHGPERGAVLVEAGLGGPDAVRQLLAAIPDAFPRPVLVRLQLDGGRYDRLVRQMERAASLPVQLAMADQEAVAGQVYFLPPELGLRRDKGALWFDTANAGQLLPEALPPADSAVLLLSGASRRLAEATAAAAWSTALVAGQAADGSYDPDATFALLERGGVAAAPVELAAMLAQRWLGSDGPAPDLEEFQP